jgi:hypothetical protein
VRRAYSQSFAYTGTLPGAFLPGFFAGFDQAYYTTGPRVRPVGFEGGYSMRRPRRA